MKALNELKEKLILKRIIKGEKEAFSEVYDFYVVRIYRFVYLKTNSRETAEDITSEVFMRCWKSIMEKQERILDSGDESLSETNIGPFLYKIARNTVIDHYRKNQLITTEIGDEIKDKIADGKQNIIDNINIKQEIEDLIETIKMLKDEYQEVLLLKYVEDLTNEEIAEITGKSMGSVRVLAHRAIKSLGKVMKLKENLRKKGKS